MSIWRAILLSLALGIAITISVAMVLNFRTATLVFDAADTAELRRQQWSREERWWARAAMTASAASTNAVNEQ